MMQGRSLIPLIQPVFRVRGRIEYGFSTEGAKKHGTGLGEERPSSLAREICAFWGLNAFKEDGDALAYADAHGAEGVFSGGAQELVHRSGDEARAAGAEGVAESNCATVGIYVGRVVGHAEFAENGEGLRGEGFV